MIYKNIFLDSEFTLFPSIISRLPFINDYPIRNTIFK